MFSYIQYEAAEPHTRFTSLSLKAWHHWRYSTFEHDKRGNFGLRFSSAVFNRYRCIYRWEVNYSFVGISLFDSSLWQLRTYFYNHRPKKIIMGWERRRKNFCCLLSLAVCYFRICRLSRVSVIIYSCCMLSVVVRCIPSCLSGVSCLALVVDSCRSLFLFPMPTSDLLLLKFPFLSSSAVMRPPKMSPLSHVQRDNFEFQYFRSWNFSANFW